MYQNLINGINANDDPSYLICTYIYQFGKAQIYALFKLRDSLIIFMTAFYSQITDRAIVDRV